MDKDLETQGTIMQRYQREARMNLNEAFAECFPERKKELVIETNPESLKDFKERLRLDTATQCFGAAMARYKMAHGDGRLRNY